ncbi:MAG: 3-hydroxyacyl-ACP dehydratase FabZ family protein [Planctomycetaceae bacterium]
MTRDQIQKLIPHRPPFLWLDEVISMDELSVHARTFIDPKFDIFKGHYPEFPVLPGVIQCEMAFQAAAVLISTILATGSGKVPVVARLNNTKFRRLVRPGETVDIHVTITDKVKTAFYMTGTVGVGGDISCRLDFTVTEATMA